MTTLGLSFKGLLRRPSGFIAASLTIAIASVVLLLSFGLSKGYDNALLSSINSLGANILAIPKGCPYEATGVILSGGTLRYAVAQDNLELITKTPGVKIVSAIIMGQRPVAPIKKVHVIVGTDDNYFKLRPKLEIDKPLGEDEIALGFKIHTVLGVNPGDFLWVAGKDYKCVAVASENATEDEDLVFMNLKTAQTILGAEGMLSSILIGTTDPTNAELVAKRLMNIPDLQVVTIGDFRATITDFVSGARVAITSVLIVIMLIAAVGILTTQASAVAERRGEIGMMRAMGATKGQVLCIVTLEAILTAFFGGVLGAVIGFLLGPTASNMIKSALPQSPSGSIISNDWLSVLTTVGLVIVISIIAAFGPARSAANTKPTEAATDE